MLKIFKRLSLSILIIAFVLSSNSLAYNVNEVDSDHKKIFNYILNEYTKLADIDSVTAEDDYNQIESNIYIEEYEDYIEDNISANQFLINVILNLIIKKI